MSVVDRDTGKRLACRMHLQNAAGRPQKAGKAPYWHDHFVFQGETTLRLPPGKYKFEIECGPEYLLRTGNFVMNDAAEDSQQVDMKRVVDMAGEGWWSGDLHVQRPADDMPLLMQADDLHVAQLVEWGNLPPQAGPKTPRHTEPVDAGGTDLPGSQFLRRGAGADVRSSGWLLMLNSSQPLDFNGTPATWPTSTGVISQARQQAGAWIDVARPASWDLPLWIATGQVGSVQLAGSDLRRTSVAGPEPGCRAPDPTLYPSPAGAARWSQAIYYHLLNCGLRIGPSAGSGSGSAPNPVGYNRVYAHVDSSLNYDRWWESFRAGRVVVTNGPLLRPSVEGKPPGHVFQADAGREVELEIGLKLATREKIDYMEVVKDGRAVQSYRLDEWARLRGKLPPLRFSESGWFLLRAVTENKNTYRFACTGPYYVEIGYRRRISKESARFFLDWLELRNKQFQLDGRQPEAVAARQFWQALLEKANAP